MIPVRRPSAVVVLTLAVVVWLGGVGYGLTRVWQYATTPGSEGPHPPHWPASTRIGRATTRATVVMFVHPKCPCSRASMAELREMAAAAGGAADFVAVFLRPEGTGDDWEQTDIWTAAHRIPGVRVVVDENGDEAVRFGAETSGQVLLYDAAGNLSFAGGITASRGHEGDNPGLRDVLARIHDQPAARDRAAVYGCPLADSTTP